MTSTSEYHGAQMLPLMVDILPDYLDPGIIYFLADTELAVCACPCGCDIEVMIPFWNPIEQPFAVIDIGFHEC
jgi:hypothetical protein